MNTWNFLINPETLQEGQTYSLLQPRRGKRGDKWSQVTFLAYTSNPTEVIVQAADGSRLRVRRDLLFEDEPGPPKVWNGPGPIRYFDK